MYKHPIKGGGRVEIILVNFIYYRNHGKLQLYSVWAVWPGASFFFSLICQLS